MADTADTPGITSKTVDRTPQGKVKRWLSEWHLAERREKPWRESTEKILDLYSSKNRAGNSFNILWSNTETLRPAIYNSTPTADVRRRFRDPDPIGKIASTVLERGLTFSIDQYDFDGEMEFSALDLLLAGRGVARVKYMPTFKQSEDNDNWLGDDDYTPDEELADEATIVERVLWDKFRMGAGRVWKLVPWVGFEHEMPYDQLEEMFGKEMADKVTLQDTDSSDKLSDKGDQELKSLQKVGLVYEIWDKATRKVLFISESVKDMPLLEKDDPLGLCDFFPVPRPVYAIEDSNSTIPQLLYEKYRPQAEELNRVTLRINKIVDALKVRGAYSAHLSEVASIIESGDNAMTPISNASEVAAMGGLDKAIWMMPIDNLIKVLDGLYLARQKTIEVIYQVTGMADIMRGASNPHETATAQKIKTQWGTMRLQRIQREFQRFIRDLIRMKAEVMAKHFDAATLQMMTGIQLPDAKQKAELQQMASLYQQAQTAPMPGQMPPPPVPPKVQADVQQILALPTWDDVMKLLKSDALRAYRVDIETDSTIAESMETDMEGLQQSITAVVNLFQGVGPAIQAGYLNVDVLKSLAQTVARHTKMGDAVEDAIDKIQQPPPPPPPQHPPDFSVQVAQIKSDTDQKTTQAQADGAARVAQIQEESRLKAVEAQMQARVTEIRESGQMKQMIAQLVEDNKAQMAARADEAKSQREQMSQLLTQQMTENKSALDAAVKILVADITATKAADAATQAASEKTVNSAQS